MASHINPVYRDYPSEMAIVGRLLVEYGDLEFSLMQCIAAVRGDLDSTLKTMFRVRGETMRISIADALAHQEYIKLGLENKFEDAIAAMRFSLKIRNRFAHSYWHNPLDGLCYVSLEELAKANEKIVDLTKLAFFYLDIDLLSRHQAYFRYTVAALTFLNHEARYRAEKSPNHTLQWPRRLEPPSLCTRKQVHTDL